jgi:hypothetical protein
MSCASQQHLPITTGRVGLSQTDCTVEFYNPPVVWNAQTNCWVFPPTPGPAVQPWPPWRPTYVPPTWSGSGGCGSGGCGCGGGCGGCGSLWDCLYAMPAIAAQAAKQSTQMQRVLEKMATAKDTRFRIPKRWSRARSKAAA